MPALLDAEVERVLEIEAPALNAAVPILSQQLKAELAEREVVEALLRQLHAGEFTAGAHNVVLIAGPDSGKTRIATVLGIKAVEQHLKKVRFFATADLVNALKQKSP